MAQLILRPVADISVEHYASSGNSGYAMLSEITADNDSTYIYQSIASTSSATATSQFRMGGDFPGGTITAITAHMVVRDSDSTVTAAAVGRIQFGSSEFSIAQFSATTAYKDYTGSADSSCIDGVNSYIDQNGTLPSVTFQVRSGGNKSSSKDSNGYLRVTQIYIVIEYDEAVAGGYSCSAVAKAGIQSASVNKHSVASGGSCVFTAVPAAGYRFKGWYGDANGAVLISADNPYTNTIYSDTELYAFGEKETYKIAVVGNSEWSASVSTSSAQYGDSVVFTAKDNTGVSSFSGWYSDSGLSTLVSTDNPYTATIHGNTTLYIKTQKITYTVSLARASSTLARNISTVYIVAVDWAKMTDADKQKYYSGEFSSISDAAKLGYDIWGSSYFTRAMNLNNIPIHATVGLYAKSSTSSGAGRWSRNTTSNFFAHTGDIATIDDLTSSMTVYFSLQTLYPITIHNGPGIQSASSNYASRTQYDDFTVTASTLGNQWAFDGWYGNADYTNKLASDVVTTLNMPGAAACDIYVRCNALFPTITVQTPSRSAISDEEGVSVSECVFTTDQALQKWEARAVLGDTPGARGKGVIVESGGAVPAKGTGKVIVDWDELTLGDGEYTIAVYGHGANGYWSDESYEV